MNHLPKHVVEIRVRDTAKPRLTAEGYTRRNGSPTAYVVKLEGERIWRRLHVWQFSNVGTMFVRIKGVDYIVAEHDLPEVSN